MADHTGTFDYHDDDCLCGVYSDAWCARDMHCWSCCGASARDSDCTAPNMHPTFWKHPRHGATIAGWDAVHRPIFKSRAELRALFPELWGDEAP